MVVDPHRLLAPSLTWVFEAPHQFSFLGVDTDNGISPTGKAITQLSQALKLGIAPAVGCQGNLLVVDTQREVHGLEQPGDSAGPDIDAA